MASETDTLTHTKLYKPQIPANLVDRPWLHDWLSQHRQRPLTLVSASAGYGKTTLISRWLELATLSVGHRGDIDLLLKGMPENNRYVTDYLLTEVLNRLEPAIQEFLLKTSILDRLSLITLSSWTKGPLSAALLPPDIG